MSMAKKVSELENEVRQLQNADRSNRSEVSKDCVFIQILVSSCIENKFFKHIYQTISRLLSINEELKSALHFQEASTPAITDDVGTDFTTNRSHES